MAKTEYGQNLSSELANSVYLLKTEDDKIIGQLSLEEGLNLNTHIEDLQGYIFELADTLGVVGESDPNRKIYTSKNYLPDGTGRKLALSLLDAQVKINEDGIASNLVLILANTAQINLNIARLDVIQKLITPETIVSEAGLIVLTDNKESQEVRLVSDGGAVELGALTFDTATTRPNDGAKIVLVGHSDIDTVKVVDNEATQYGLYLNGDALLKKYRVLSLVYNAELERFIETGRNF